jgi:hypothetical protein
MSELIERRQRERRQIVTDYIRKDRRQRVRRKQIENAKVAHWMMRFDNARNGQ